MRLTLILINVIILYGLTGISIYCYGEKCFAIIGCLHGYGNRSWGFETIRIRNILAIIVLR